MDLKSSSANTWNDYITQINKSTITAVQRRTGTLVTLLFVYESHIFNNQENTQKNNNYVSRVPVRFQMCVLNHSKCKRCCRCPTWPSLSMSLFSPAAGYARMRGFRGHSPARWSRPARLPDERGGLRDGSAALLLRGERRAAAVGARGAPVWTLAGAPEP